MNIAFSCCIVPCTLLIHDLISILIFSFRFKVSLFLIDCFEIDFSIQCLLILVHAGSKIFGLWLLFLNCYNFFLKKISCNLVLNIFLVFSYCLVLLWILMSRAFQCHTPFWFVIWFCRFFLLFRSCWYLKNVWNRFFDTILIIIWYIGVHSFSISCFLFSIKLLSNVFIFSCNVFLEVYW